MNSASSHFTVCCTIRGCCCRLQIQEAFEAAELWKNTLILELSKDDILPRQNSLQRGLTSKTSPSNGSLFLTEAISESIDMKQRLRAIFVDATQAFDRVWHGPMLVKLYDVGLTGRKWLFLNNWYKELTSQVNWEGDVSSSFSKARWNVVSLRRKILGSRTFKFFMTR